MVDFKRWWVPAAAPIFLLSCELDVRTGGKYRLVFGVHGSDQQAEFFGRYIEVTPHARIVWTNEEGDEGGAITTVTFEERGGQTLHVEAELVPVRGGLGVVDHGLDEVVLVPPGQHRGGVGTGRCGHACGRFGENSLLHVLRQL